MDGPKENRAADALLTVGFTLVILACIVAVVAGWWTRKPDAPTRMTFSDEGAFPNAERVTYTKPPDLYAFPGMGLSVPRSPEVTIDWDHLRAHPERLPPDFKVVRP